MATLNPGLNLRRFNNLLVVIKQTAFEEYSQVNYWLATDGEHALPDSHSTLRVAPNHNSSN